MTIRWKIVGHRETEHATELFNPLIPCQIEYSVVLRCFIAASCPLPEGDLLQWSEPSNDIMLSGLGMDYKQRLLNLPTEALLYWSADSQRRDSHPLLLIFSEVLWRPANALCNLESSHHSFSLDNFYEIENWSESFSLFSRRNMKTRLAYFLNKKGLVIRNLQMLYVLFLSHICILFSGKRVLKS